jgi:hypothetical protein
VEALQRLGWTDGGNVRIDHRWGGGDADNIRKQAVELAALAPDVILATGGSATEQFFSGDPHRADRAPDNSALSDARLIYAWW